MNRWRRKLFVRKVFTARRVVVASVFDSSTAMIILTVLPVNAGVVTFRQSTGIVIGAHVLFSIPGVLLVVGFVPVFEKLLNKMFSEKVESPT